MGKKSPQFLFSSETEVEVFALSIRDVFLIMKVHSFRNRSQGGHSILNIYSHKGTCT